MESQRLKVTAKIKPPFVVKAQVLVAGRGKAGGILFADSVEEAEKAAGKILKMRIKGMPVKSVWIDCRPKTLSSKSSVSSIFVLSRHSTTY
jgi:succinyl-CoA synthetase beta subunit